MSALKRVESVLEDNKSNHGSEQRLQIHEPPPASIDLASNLAKTNDLVLENVTFSYPSNPDVEVLKGTSLRLPVGKVTALVGASGAGKTTVVQVCRQASGTR